MLLDTSLPGQAWDRLPRFFVGWAAAVQRGKITRPVFYAYTETSGWISRRERTSAARPAAEPDAAALWGARTSSDRVFHSPQEGHFPPQRGDSKPQLEQTYTVFAFGAMPRCPFVFTSAPSRPVPQDSPRDGKRHLALVIRILEAAEFGVVREEAAFHQHGRPCGFI